MCFETFRVVNFFGRYCVCYQFALVKALNRQLWMVVNFFLTVVGIFVFGYYAAYFAGLSSTGVRKSCYVLRLTTTIFKISFLLL